MKKHIYIVTSVLLCYFVILFYRMFIFNLHFQLVYVFPVLQNMLHKNTSQCKILIVPEERFCFFFLFSFIREAD